MTNLNASSILSSVGTNCMGVSHLSLADQIYLNSRFSGMPSRNRAGSNWSDQKICQTDLQLSLVSKV